MLEEFLGKDVRLCSLLGHLCCVVKVDFTGSIRRSYEAQIGNTLFNFVDDGHA